MRDVDITRDIEKLRSFSRVTCSKALEIENFLEDVTKTSSEMVDTVKLVHPLKLTKTRAADYWRAIGYLEAIIRDYERASDLTHCIAEHLEQYFTESDEEF